MEEGACDGWGCRAAATGTGGAFRVVLRGDSMRAPWSWSCGPVSYETNLATHPATHKGNWPGRTIPVGRRAAFSLSPVPTPRGSPRCRGRRCRVPPSPCSGSSWNLERAEGDPIDDAEAARIAEL